MKHPLLIEHQALSPLMPHLKSSVQKGLTAHLSGNQSFTGTASEIYAKEVAEKVSELDNSLESLHLTRNYIMGLSISPAPSPAEYRYHYENFIFRAVGLIDRAHRFVGASLMLEQSKYECVSGNKYVASKVKVDHPETHSALEKIAYEVSTHRTLRNELIHSSAFSDRELGLFSACKALNVTTPEGTDVTNLMKGHFSLNAEEVAILIAKVEKLLVALIDSLAPVYEIVHADAQPVVRGRLLSAKS